MVAKQKQKKKHVDILSAMLILLLLGLVSWQLIAMRDKLSFARAEETSLAERIARQEQENRSLEAALARAEDPEYLQELARQDLGMVTPGQKDFYDVSS